MTLAKIENIKTKRGFGAAKLKEEIGKGQATGEAGVSEGVAATGPRHSGSRARRKPRISGASMPTVQIGGKFRPK
jgi:hypothetical protein